ncbi:MAG: hypothetical protein JXR91_06550 [Deltaproteobacteria bacterium]|nr:hypothetical protein [Deltaproteobacteria bacterium]
MKFSLKTAGMIAGLTTILVMSGCGKLNPKTEGQIYSALDAKNKTFQKCYEKALNDNRNIKGNVQLKLEFSPKNKNPQKVTVTKTNIKNQKMLKCVSKAADKIDIQDAPGVFVEGNYTLNFDFEK